MNSVLESDALWPFEQVQFSFEPAHAALVVIDMQYFDAHPDYGLAPAIKAMGYQSGRYYFDRLANTVIPNLRRLLTAFRDHQLRVIYVLTGPATVDGSDLLPRTRNRRAEMKLKYGISGIFPPGSFEREIIPELTPQLGDILVNKNTTGAFTSSELDQVLRITRTETVLFAGVVTNVCIESTARDAADRGYNCIVVDDACAAYDPESHDATLRTFRRFFGRVHRTDELLTMLRQAAPASLAASPVMTT